MSGRILITGGTGLIGNRLSEMLIDQGYDPLAYRLFCLNAHYRAKLNFTWDGLDASAKALDRLRAAAFAWGTPGAANAEFVERFAEPVNEDLNMPRAMAVVWELVNAGQMPTDEMLAIAARHGYAHEQFRPLIEAFAKG